jgi:hypothetical protein
MMAKQASFSDEGQHPIPADIAFASRQKRLSRKQSRCGLVHFR